MKTGTKYPDTFPDHRRSPACLRLFLPEWGKLMRFPVLWLLLLLFISLNIFFAGISAGTKNIQDEIRGYYAAASGDVPGKIPLGSEAASGDLSGGIPSDIGADIRMDPCADDLYSEKAYPRQAGSFYQENYDSYHEAYSSMYDGLNMMEVMNKKAALAGCTLSGSFGTFIRRNYAILQRRVEEIRTGTEADGPFYPGDILEIHGKMYGLLKLCLLEAILFTVLCVFFLMDEDRINAAGLIVCCTRFGRKCMLVRQAAGAAYGLAGSVLMIGSGIGAFLLLVPMKGFWETPVTSVMVMENRGLYEYPFITFAGLTIRQELILSLGMCFLLLIPAALAAGALMLFLKNGYLAAVCLASGFFLLYALPFLIRTAGWLRLLILMTPAVLWNYCGLWFIENDICLSFAGSEWWTLLLWTVLTAGACLAAWLFFRERDL